VKPQTLCVTLVVSSVLLLLGTNAWAAPHEKVLHAFRVAPGAFAVSSLAADARLRTYRPRSGIEITP
jgi:hypothetical protein